MLMIKCKEYTTGDPVFIAVSAIQGVTRNDLDEYTTIFTEGFVWRVKDNIADVIRCLTGGAPCLTL